MKMRRCAANVRGNWKTPDLQSQTESCDHIEVNGSNSTAAGREEGTIPTFSPQKKGVDLLTFPRGVKTRTSKPESPQPTCPDAAVRLSCVRLWVAAALRP